MKVVIWLRISWLSLTLAACAWPPLAGSQVLQNGLLRADFNERGLVALHRLPEQHRVVLGHDRTALFLGDDCVDTEFQAAVLETAESGRVVYRVQSGRWTARVVYELRPDWHFLTKHVEVTAGGEREFRVRRIDLFNAQLAVEPSSELRQREAVFLRYPGHGLFLTLQNPFGQWKRQGTRCSLAYPPDLLWPPQTNVFVSDRLCLGVYVPSGLSFPARMVPEWHLDPGDLETGPRIDHAEVDAVVECARAFLTYRPAKPERVMVGWCVNDYQIDIATPEGRTEYKRIIDQVAAIGGRHILFDPANSVDAPLSENRDAWGWENLLWFTLGQKLRKGEWDPATDKLPASVQEMVDYARAKDVQFLAYVYPSLPFLQRPEWTSWVPNGQPGGYLGADTGQRSFQDWLVGKLVDFHRSTGASGFSFDHWWIAYEETPSSKYAQWDGCRRILHELRKQVPDVVMDGRQQYHWFGVWTWLAGSYPHPLVSDEQPESFRAFPDLHWSRVSADRQRRSSWFYRQECFAPVEIIPGYMTHQTPRNDANGQCPRDRFRPADWDLLGWKYSVISSIASAPYQLVINFIPARDEREFQAFSPTDREWFRDWLDWTEYNIGVLRHVRPILGAPRLGAADGWAAFEGERGFVFLFNPNYRPLEAAFSLDPTIGLKSGQRFLVKQLYPDPERGRLLAGATGATWAYGERVTLPMPGTEAAVFEIIPAPEPAREPRLAGVVGTVALNERKLEISGARGEPGTERTIAIDLPSETSVDLLSVNGRNVSFQRQGKALKAQVRFAGAPFAARQSVGEVPAGFSARTFTARTAVPARVFRQLADRKLAWPVEYTPAEREAVWLNADRLLLYINIAEPDDEKMSDPVLRINGQSIPVKRAYTAIVRSNPRNTFTGWYADVTDLRPDILHDFEVRLPELKPGQFLGLFFDTVEAEYTDRLAEP